MNQLEQLGITLILSLLSSVIKNPASKAAYQNQLIELANDIYLEFGVVPPVVIPTPAVAPVAVIAAPGPTVAASVVPASALPAS